LQGHGEDRGGNRNSNLDRDGERRNQTTIGSNTSSGAGTRTPQDRPTLNRN
jgi:hypothetical protein